MDCLLSRLLEVSTILLWHGLWSLADLLTRLHLCPGEDEYCQPGAVMSLTVGWTGGVLLFLSQFPLLQLSQGRHRTRLRLLAFNITNYLFTLAGVIATVHR